MMILFGLFFFFHEMCKLGYDLCGAAVLMPTNTVFLLSKFTDSLLYIGLSAMSFSN